ncbi:Sb-PDE family phosphodiesterase [Maribellus maritimus]|uniref:Sb-PDE family phosphodiesterase n=1 Tax=Maribellus maritimus TaxID=2870838 RepID=UPI001EEA9728|nr:Sb-PDE family phosphodiesterase [Maribellus maritimus]MCG6189595.1 hypothetical protein [Maribellus maritimus]
MCTKKQIILWIFIFFTGIVSGQSRKIINIPDIAGYQTLKCDFHIHTIFSDGTVWPTVRIEEAWEEGLDAIAISDHIEYRPHSKDVVADHNRSFEIAEPLAQQKNVVLIRAAEITRSMPPGHLNALFIRNANLLERDDVMDAIKEAREQGSFIFWNHPGWKAQQPDSTVWWEEHTELLDNGLLHGIEVYNSNEYYPEALEWANEKSLTMLGNSDVHDPIGMSYDLSTGRRPMTLVFAKSKTTGGIKEALFSQRTAVYFDETVIGKSEILEPLFFASLAFKDNPLKIQNGASRRIEITNKSDIDYELELVQPGVGFDAPENVTLKAGQITPLTITGNSDEISQVKTLKVYYGIKNMLVNPEENLIVTFSFRNL